MYLFVPFLSTVQLQGYKYKGYICFVLHALIFSALERRIFSMQEYKLNYFSFLIWIILAKVFHCHKWLSLLKLCQMESLAIYSHLGLVPKCCNIFFEVTPKQSYRTSIHMCVNWGPIKTHYSWGKLPGWDKFSDYVLFNSWYTSVVVFEVSLAIWRPFKL